MHISTIVRDCAWFKYSEYREAKKGQDRTWKHYLTTYTTLALSLLHGAAFVGAMYVSLDIVFSQYELASPLPICTIIFTALYGVTELGFGVMQTMFCALSNDKVKDTQSKSDVDLNVQNSFNYDKTNNYDKTKLGIKVFIFTNRIGMAGMIACAVAGVVEYFNSGTHAPCMLQTLSEKIHLTPETHLAPEVVYGIIAAAVVLLLALYVASVYGRDKTDNDETTVIGTVKERVMTELKGFVAPCLGG